MNTITEITRRDIFELFRDGFKDGFGFTHSYCYFGRLEEVEFLSRLYNLEELPGKYGFSNARGDIIKHTVASDDYPLCWVFEDERFRLKSGDEYLYLKFISEIFHPAVRNEQGCWRDFLIKVNDLLNCDGYELYPAEKISQRDVFKGRALSNKSVTIKDDCKLLSEYVLTAIETFFDKLIEWNFIKIEFLRRYNGEYIEYNEDFNDAFKMRFGFDIEGKIFSNKEFLFQYIEWVYSEILEPSSGRYQYTCKLNKIFENFELKIKIVNGKVIELGSMDKEILSNTARWLISYPTALQPYNLALRQFNNREYNRNCLDNMRLVFELLVKQIIGNTKALENNIEIIGQRLKEQGVAPQLRNEIRLLIDYYTKYQNDYVKHDDKVSASEIEIIIEQTAILIKFLIKVLA